MLDAPAWTARVAHPHIAEVARYFASFAFKPKDGFWHLDRTAHALRYDTTTQAREPRFFVGRWASSCWPARTWVMVRAGAPAGWRAGRTGGVEGCELEVNGERLVMAAGERRHLPGQVQDLRPGTPE